MLDCTKAYRVAYKQGHREKSVTWVAERLAHVERLLGNVLLPDLTDATNPKITLAREGIVVSEAPDRLHLHLIDGSAHETDPTARSVPFSWNRACVRAPCGVNTALPSRAPFRVEPKR